MLLLVCVVCLFKGKWGGNNTMLIGSLSLRPQCSFVLFVLSSVVFCLLFGGMLLCGCVVGVVGLCLRVRDYSCYCCLCVCVCVCIS